MKRSLRTRWTRLLDRHGNSWALRIIWLAEYLDHQGPEGLDYLGSLESLRPSSPADRFYLACTLLPRWSDWRQAKPDNPTPQIEALRQKLQELKPWSVPRGRSAVVAGLVVAYAALVAAMGFLFSSYVGSHPQVDLGVFLDVVVTGTGVSAVMAAVWTHWAWRESGRAARRLAQQ